MQIEIGLGTYQALTLLLKDEGDSYDAVIQRLLSANKGAASPSLAGAAPLRKVKIAEGEQASWFRYGVSLPVGTQLQAYYKARRYVGTVQANGLLVAELSDQPYPSLSAAAEAVTGSKRSGWVFWQYQNAAGEWREMGQLRR